MSSAPYQSLPSDDVPTSPHSASPSPSRGASPGPSAAYPPTAAQHPGPERSQSRLREQFRHLRPIYIVPAAALALMAVAVISHATSRGGGSSRPDSVLKYKEGLAYVPEEEWRGEHPIVELMGRAKRLHREMEQVKEQTRDLQGATRDYLTKFGMMPPEGFEKWHAFALSINSTTAPSLIPFAHESVLPYLSLPPELLQSRVPPLQEERGIFGMTFFPEREEYSKRIEYKNEDDVVGYMSPRWDYPLVLEPIVHLVPPAQQPDRPMQMSICVKDGSCRLSSGWLMQRSREMAQEGKVWDEADLVKWEEDDREKRGWLNTCPPPPDMASYHKTDRSFVYSFSESMDFCRHPELVKTNGEMIMEAEHIMRPLAPMLAVSRLSHGADMVGTPTRAVNDTRESEQWHEKTKHQLVWRGTITGVFHRERWDWRSSQRDRVAMLGADRENATDIEVLVETDEGTRVVQAKKGGMVNKWLDVGVIELDLDNMCGIGPTGEACRLDGGPEVPCTGHNQACEDMKNEIKWVPSMENHDALPYKYRLDMDGYGWSSRFRKLLSSKSLIIKSTVYPEWWTAQAIPWFHLVPLKYDFSDLWDVLAFFDGPPDDADSGGKVVDRDALAHEIAEQGRSFAMEQLRWEDMQSYMLLLLLEYRRAWSFDRQAATYDPNRASSA